MLSTVSRAYNPDPTAQAVRSTNHPPSGSAAVQPTQPTPLTGKEPPPRGPIEVTPQNTYKEAPIALTKLTVEESTTLLLPEQDSGSTALESFESQALRRRPDGTNRSATQDSPTVTAPPVAPTAPITATDTQRFPRRRQGSIPPPRRRDSQPPVTPEGADMTSGLDPIAESATKDNKRLIRRLIKPMEELNKTVQAAEWDFNLAHNTQGGMIRMPDYSHDEAIHKRVRELLEGSNSAELRRFQEASVEINRIITVSGVVTECHMLTQVPGYTR
jgi:hypothetical protein